MNRIIFFTFFICSITHAQDDLDVVEAKPLLCFNHEFGVKYSTTLTSFNQQLDSFNYTQINALGFSMSGGIGLKTNHTFHFLEIGASFTGNGADRGGFQVSITDFDFGINSMLILRKLSPFALEPSIKIGVGMTQIAAISQDSAVTVNDFYNGVNTMFYEQSKPQVYLQPGIFIGHSIGKKGPPILYLNIAYKFGLTDYGWSIPDFPVKRLDGLIARVGLRYLIRR
ncbi:MAG: hypothetical protein HUJ25_07230 [Crocinitomicaceae bacterium]|nr:hypothetical protein [Crocinitomicaceae bacterium]